MQNKEQVKQRLLAEGFSILHEYDDAPGETFPDHTHPTDQHIVILKGSITVKMDGKTTTLNPGDEMFFPANIVHSATVGPQGCLYIDGERPSV